MYSSSRTWVSPQVIENEQRIALNQARWQLCPRSPFWHKNFDYAKHKADWEAGERRRIEQKMKRDMEEAEERRQSHQRPFPAPPPLRPPFGGKELVLKTNRGMVLSYQTVFCPHWEIGKETVAPWPQKSEAKYEGDDRISTDKLHARFPGAPRVAGNATVNWQHRAVIPQYPFDDFYYPVPQAVEVFLRMHYVQELEFTEAQGEGAIGKDLMQMLDPTDQR